MSADIDILEEIVIDEKIKDTAFEPPLYKVILLNDNNTPIDFVIELLIQIFRHSSDTAEKLTLTIHHEGAGVAGIYTYEIAEQKAIEATNLSRQNGFPLQIKVEEE